MIRVHTVQVKKVAEIKDRLPMVRRILVLYNQEELMALKEIQPINLKSLT